MPPVAQAKPSVQLCNLYATRMLSIVVWNPTPENVWQVAILVSVDYIYQQFKC